MTREAGLAVVARHRDRLEPLRARGFWLHGSLALGGYHHGTSDLDLVVELDHALDDDERLLVAKAHDEAGPLLSAAYVLDRGDPERRHPTWTHGWHGDRRVSLITRAELHLAHPRDWPEIADVPGVVTAEVRRAWRREPPWTYLSTEYVDLALTSVARAVLTRRSGHLTGKDDAIAHLVELGVPPRLAGAVEQRRAGREARPHGRVARACATWWTVQRLL